MISIRYNFLPVVPLDIAITSLVCASVWILVLAESALCSPALKTSSLTNFDTIVRPLQSIIVEARKSPSPVYLPTWLPSANIGKYAEIYLGKEYNPDVEDWCEIRLAEEKPICNANTDFYICSAKGLPHVTKHKVTLTNGLIGYIQPAGNFREIQWAKGKYFYSMGLASLSDQELIKTADPWY